MHGPQFGIRGVRPVRTRVTVPMRQGAEAFPCVPQSRLHGLEQHYRFAARRVAQYRFIRSLTALR